MRSSTNFYILGFLKKCIFAELKILGLPKLSISVIQALLSVPYSPKAILGETLYLVKHACPGIMRNAKMAPDTTETKLYINKLKTILTIQEM